MLQAKLIVVGGEVKTQEVKLKLPTVIGRGKDANLKVPLALISRMHCEIRERNGRLFIRDLGSLNGTYVNNYKITSEQPLLPGELVTVGSVTFRADYELSPIQAPENGRLPSGKPAIPKQPAPARATEEPIVFSPVVAEPPTDRVPIKKTAATAAVMDATVAGTMSVTITSDRPVKLDESASSKPAKSPAAQAAAAPAAKAPAAAAAKATAQDHSQTELPSREKTSKPNLPATGEIQNGGGTENVLDDFPMEATAQKSISLSALEELQFKGPRQVSFIGDLNFGSAALEPTSEPVRIDLGNNEPVSPTADDTADFQLDSFLRRINQPSD